MQIADRKLQISNRKTNFLIGNLKFALCNLRLKMVHPAGLSPANSPFEAEHDRNFTTDAKMVAADGNAPSAPRL
jgi:hypothetical protein